MSNLFYSDYHALTKLIFKIYDFDKNGLISKDDIRIVLLYIPLNTTGLGKYLEKYEDRVESQIELVNLLDKIFVNRKYITCSQFSEIIENYSSEIFIYVILIYSAFSIFI
jgi:hypothetical protein